MNKVTLKTGKEVTVVSDALDIQGRKYYIVDLGSAKFVQEGVLTRYVLVGNHQISQNINNDVTS